MLINIKYMCVYECVCELVLDCECVCVVSVIGVTFILSYIYASCPVCLSPGGVVNKQKYAMILLKIIKAIIFILGMGAATLPYSILISSSIYISLCA